MISGRGREEACGVCLEIFLNFKPILTGSLPILYSVTYNIGERIDFGVKLNSKFLNNLKLLIMNVV